MLAYLNMPLPIVKKILPAIDKAILEQKYMISLVNKYNECTGGNEKSIVYKKQLPFVRFKFAPIVSLEHPQFQFNDGYHDRTIPSKISGFTFIWFSNQCNFPKDQ